MRAFICRWFYGHRIKAEIVIYPEPRWRYWCERCGANLPGLGPPL